MEPRDFPKGQLPVRVLGVLSSLLVLDSSERKPLAPPTRDRSAAPEKPAVPASPSAPAGAACASGHAEEARPLLKEEDPKESSTKVPGSPEEEAVGVWEDHWLSTSVVLKHTSVGPA